MNLKPYPTYKESGVEWIGEIPEGWEVHRLKYFTSKINSGITPTGGSQTYVDKGIPLLRSQNIHFDGLRLDDVANITEVVHNEMSNSKVKKNDVLLNITGASIGRCTFFDCEYNEANVNQHVCILRPNGIHHKILTYYLISKFGQDQIFSLEMGTSREGLNYQQIGDFIILIPRELEQSTIAAFLDKKTAQIDELIAKNKRLIDLLREKRTALINHAVTKGLDPNAKMKDSGIEWIGEIPEGWKVHKIKYKTIINKKKLEEDTNPNYVINYLDISNVESNGNIIKIEEQLFDDAPSRARRVIKNGDTIISTVRTYLKAIAYLANPPNNMIVSTGFAVLEPIDNVDSKYIFYAISSEIFIQNVIAYSKGVAYPAINPSELGQIHIIIPPFPEQSKIAPFLNKKTTQIDKEIDLIERKIELLEEYRRSLIHHIVTGKYDVRGVEA